MSMSLLKHTPHMLQQHAIPRSLSLSSDRRLQGRKADLVAKILARAESSHELVGGAGNDKSDETSASTIPAPVSTTTATVGPTDSVSGDGGGGDGGAPLDARAPTSGSGERGTGDCGNHGGGKGSPLAGAGTSGRDAGLVGRNDARRFAPWEGGRLREEEEADPNSTKAAGAAATREDEQGERYREKEAAPQIVLSESTGGGEVGPEGRAPPVRDGENTGGKIAVSMKKKRSGEGGVPRRRPVKADAAAVRTLRRRLEHAAARAAAAAMSVPAGAGHEENEEEAEARREASEGVWDVLRSLPTSGGGGGGGSLSLEKLLGDGITAESLVGITQGLRHACGIDSTRAGSKGPKEGGGDGLSKNTQRASEVRQKVFGRSCWRTSNVAGLPMLPIFQPNSPLVWVLRPPLTSILHGSRTFFGHLTPAFWILAPRRVRVSPSCSWSLPR